MLTGKSLRQTVISYRDSLIGRDLIESSKQKLNFLLHNVSKTFATDTYLA
jgi:hypothetical protein